MKYLIPWLAVGLFIAVGCSNKQPGADSSSAPLTDVNSAPPVQAVPYTPTPTQTVTPAFAEAPMNPPATPAMATAARPAYSSAASGSYTIRAGDTLWKIAAAHYGNGNQWKKIADANPGLDPSKLIVGKTITIP